MLDEKRIDARLEVLARYRDLGPGERFLLWLAYPGLRDGFEAIDRAAAGRGNERLATESARASEAVRAESWPARTGACSRRPRQGSSPDRAVAGCCRGR